MTHHPHEIISSRAHRSRIAAILGFAVAALIGLSASEAAAQGLSKDRLQQLDDLVDLTPLQRHQLEGLSQRHAADVAQTRERLRAIQGQIAQAWRAPERDGQLLRRLFGQMGALRRALVAQEAWFRAAVERILTPEQRRRLALGGRNQGVHSIDRGSSGGGVEIPEPRPLIIPPSAFDPSRLPTPNVVVDVD